MLTKEQLVDLRQLQELAHRLGAEVVIIGATALRCFVQTEIFTKDVDLVIALDLEGFTEFAKELTALIWTHEAKREHRWHGPQGSTVDLVPAGPQLRMAGTIVWPESEFVMSLVGFDHVFDQSVDYTFNEKDVFKVAPPQVVALLKIIAYMEDPQRRKKDLVHLELLLGDYEATGDRIFGDDVFAAELDDIEYANAFLLGSDIGAMTNEEEGKIVTEFLEQQTMPDNDLADVRDEELGGRERKRREMQLRAFRKGFTPHRPS